MGGWFKKEINSVDDFKGLIMRIPGLGADVLSDYFGIKTDKKIFGKALSIGEISTELKKGTIQAAEWIGPHDDFQLNLHKAGAKYYYYPGWWEPSTTFDILVNQKAWDDLPDPYRSIFRSACMETYLEILSDYDRQNSQYLVNLKNLGVKILPFPEFLLKEAKLKTDKLLELYDETIDHFGDVHKEWRSFKNKIREWSSLA